MLKRRLLLPGLLGFLLLIPVVTEAGNVEVLLQRLQERIEALERKNSELEKKNERLEELVKGGAKAAPEAQDKALADRIKNLEEKNAKLEAAMEDGSQVSKEEAPLAAKLKELRQDVMDYKQHARMIEKMSKVEIGGDLNVTVQGTRNNDDNKARGTNRGDKADMSYSAGLHASAPIGETGKIYLRANIAQGEGVTRWLPPMFASPNADLEYDDARIRLVEAWYQAHIHLPWGASHDESKQSLFLNIGKLDPTGFFDANAAANTENEQFMADIFKNNISIEWGGDQNAYGPGLRLAYLNEQNENLKWQLSFGLFEGNQDSTGDGNQNEDDTFQDVFDRPFLIAEAGITRKLGDLEGNYRVYGWVNKGKHTKWRDASQVNEENAGWGISIDQQVSENVTLFSRYGMQDKRVSTFDRTFSVGGQMTGKRWDRPDDVAAVAYGFSSPSHDYKRVSLANDGYYARESEHYIEAYYNIKVNDQLTFTPDLQYVMNPGGDDNKDDFLIYGLRMFLTF